MHNSNKTSDHALPTTGKLVKSTLIAFVTAALLLVLVVIPAEYGIDPTGIGEALGLKRMGEIKVMLNEEAAKDLTRTLNSEETLQEVQADVSTSTEPAETAPVAQLQAHEMQVTLTPGQGAEIKVEMKKGLKVNFIWWTDAAKANFDMHADSKTLKINYHNYSKGSEQRVEGEIEAAFDGSHGWFWRNRGSKTMTITLQTQGEYSSIKRVL